MKVRVFLALALLMAAGCSTRFIEGTKIEDTPQNKTIAGLVEKYRLAVEHRDLDTLKEMISRRYFSNAGTTADSNDDYGWEQVDQKILPMLRDNVKSVQYVIYLRSIEFAGADLAYADFEYYYKFFYVDEGKDRWIAKNDFNRLEFRLENGVWRITAGL